MSQATNAPSVAVIGGGLTGLAAANRWLELTANQNSPGQLTLFESSPHPGGLVGTIERDGYLIDTGADSFITNKPGALALCQRIGLADRLQATDARYRGALVLCRGRPVPVPEGFQLLSPSAMWPVLKSPILSPWGKLRLASELFIPARRGMHDETLASFVRRRFGTEALDRLVQPLVGGIYTSDPEELSLAATLPRFLEMEQQYGSLIRAARRTARAGETDDRVSSGARYGLFAGFQGGLKDLVDALSTRVAARCHVRGGMKVQSIVRSPARRVSDQVPPALRYRLEFANGESADFDQVIVCTSSYVAARLLKDLDSDLANELATIEYASSAIVVTGHELRNVRDPLNAFGLVIPHRERRKILAVSFSSRKFANRAPEGRVLFRTFVGGAMQPEFLDLDDARLTQLVLSELAETLGVSGSPDFTHIVRYHRAMPQYKLGHLDRVAKIEALTGNHPGLELAGNAYHGVGIPDAIHSGEQASQRLLTSITAH